MKKFAHSCFQFCESIIKYIALLPLAFLFVASLRYQNTISFDIFETSILVPNGTSFILSAILSFGALYALTRLFKYISDTCLFVALSTIYLIIGIYILTNMTTIPRHDSGICYWNALNYVQGNYTNLQFGEYFYKWPHQLGLVSYNCLLVSISEDINIIYFTNLIYIIFTNYFIWRCVKLFNKENSLINKLTILLTFAFLPQFFYFIFPYGQTPGLFFLTGCLYFAIRFIRDDCKWSFIPCLIFIAIACILGMNYAIGGVALSIILFMYFCKSLKARYLLFIPGILISMILPGKLIISHYEQIADIDLSNGMPSILYVAMGLQENEEPGADWRANGWFNSFSSDTYIANNCDVDVCSQIAWDSIRDRAHTFISKPDYAWDFFKEKIITTWCEPTYQSIWSGPLLVFGSTTDVPILQELYTGGPIFSYLSSAMNIFIVMIFGFSFWYILMRTFIRKEPLNIYELFSILFFLGGFIFHMFWETKSRYIYFYVIMLIPLACCGIQQAFLFMDDVIHKLKSKTKNLRNNF